MAVVLVTSKSPHYAECFVQEKNLTNLNIKNVIIKSLKIKSKYKKKILITNRKHHQSELCSYNRLAYN